MEIGKFKLAKADLVRPPNRPAQEQIIPKQKPYTEKVFKLEVDDFIKGFIGGFPKDEMLLKIQSVLDKAVDAGAIEPQEGIKYLKERKQQLVDFARENYGQELPGIEEDRNNFAIGGGVIEGEDLGSREGFSGPKLIKQGPDKGKYIVRYRDKKFGKRKSGTGFNEGNTPPMTKEEAEKFYNNRQAEMSKYKASGQKTKILNQTEQINSFVNNFFDNNINKYSVRDYDKFEKDLIKEFKKSKISSLGEKGRNILRHGLPNIGAKDSNIPFEKYNSGVYFSQGDKPEKAYKNFFKKLFYSGKMETDPILRKRVGEYLDYYSVDKKFYGDGSPIDREGLKRQYSDTLDNLRDVMFILGDDKVGTGKFRSNIIRNYFPDSMDKYINKKNRSSLIYDEKLKQIESKLTPEQLKKVLGGETSIKNFMNKQSDLLKEIFDVSTLDSGLKFNLDHAEGIAEIAKMDNPQDIMRGLNNLVGMTSARNYELGWRGYSTKRKSLLNDINQGIDVDKNLQELNDLTKSVYPEVKGKDAYKMVGNKIVPTKDFNFTYQPENAFKQYFTELTSTPKSLDVLKSQYETNPKFKEFIQKDPELTSKIDETYNKMIDVFQNPKFKSVLQNSGLTLRGLGQMRKGNIPGFLSTMEKLMQKNPDLRAELEYDFSDIQNQYAKASTMSDVIPIERKETPPEGTTEGGSAAAAGGATLLGKYAKPLLKNTFRTIGSAPFSLALAGMTTKEGMDEGKTFADAVTEPLVGAELLYPELFKRAGLGFNALNKLARVTSPAGITITGGGILKNVITDSEPNLLIDRETGEPKTFEREDASFVMPTMIDMNEQAYKLSKEKGIPYEDAFKQLGEKRTFAEGIESLKEKYAIGGRVGFADGPEDPKRRNFMKIMSGIASIPLLGRFIDVATTAPKVAEVVKRTAEGVPAFLTDLIAKVKLKAAEKGTKYFTGNRADEFADVYQADNYIVTEQGNKTIIREVDKDGDMLYKENQIEIEVDPETGGVSYTEASARPDAEGKLKDVEEYIEDSDLENMRKYTYDE